LDVVRIINEPTAASLAYDPRPAGRERLLVYDLGGGTFDVSIVQIEQGVVEVLASHGDTQLGGDDFDELLFDHICGEFHDQHGIDLRQSPLAKSRVMRATEQAKIALSFEPVVSVDEEFIAEKAGLPLHLRVEIRREEYETLIEPLLLKTLTSVDEALDAAGLQAQQIDQVVLVGGAIRTPMVQALLTDRLRQPLHLEVDPDLGVALGAAIQGGMIAGIDVGPVLVDITPHTLGVKALGPLHGRISEFCFSPIIPRNTPLPASRSELYSTAVDGQQGALIVVHQGEHDDVRHNHPVGEVLLDGLRDVEQGNEVLVRFDLDLDGILKVAVVERATGRSKSLVIDNAVERLRRTHASPFEPTPVIEDRGHSVVLDVPPSDEALDEAELDAMPEAPELAEACSRAKGLLDKGRELAVAANPTDADDLRRTMDQLETAMAERSLARLRQLTAELEDLVFYLHDA
jgi:molecular chaperone DnaK